MPSGLPTVKRANNGKFSHMAAAAKRYEFAVMNASPMKGGRGSQRAQSWKLRSLRLRSESGPLDWQPPRDTPRSWSCRSGRRRPYRGEPPRRHARSLIRGTLAVEASHVWQRLQGACTTPLAVELRRADRLCQILSAGGLEGFPTCSDPRMRRRTPPDNQGKRLWSRDRAAKSAE